MYSKVYGLALLLLLMGSKLTAQNCGPGSAGYYKVEFDKDGNGNTIQRGQVIDANTYAPQGIHFQSLAGGAHPLVAFDTENPITGAINGGDGDPDLGSPNEFCPGGGPGIGTGGAPNGPGPNCNPLGNILVIEETWTDTNNDGLDDVPDDLGGGGQFKITFDDPTTVGKIGFLDDIDVTVSILYSDNSTGSFSYSGPGENAYGEWDINADPNNNARNIVELTFTLVGSGGIASIETCKEFASVGDYVWHDANANGIQDNNEAGIQNATVRLIQNGTVQATTMTDANGYYAFENIDPGTYSIEFVTPSGYSETSPLGEGTISTDSDASPTNGRTADFTLNVLDYNRDIDAGFYNLASVSNLVWHDLNANGIQDNGEPGIAGTTVKISGNGTLISRTTNASGHYNFDNLEPGNYTVEFLLPTGYDKRSPLDAGNNDAKDSDADPTTGVTSTITLSSAENNVTVDAGFYKSASIGDFIWEDKNANGLQDAGELGIPGIEVRLLDGSGTYTGQSTFTDLDGLYSFANLEPGDYIIEVVYPAGLFLSPVNQEMNDAIDSDINPSNNRSGIVSLGSGETDASIDAGLYQLTSIGDYAWIDANANGIQDNGEQPAAGLTVTLFDGNGSQVGASASTAQDGSYSFAGLTPGDYYVQFSGLPQGAEFSPVNAGNEDAVDSDVDPNTGRTTTTSLQSGENDLSWDAGIFTRVSLGDNIWIDANGDGIKDMTDEGQQDVLVILKDADGMQIDQTSTNSNGDYLFSGLLPATYTVEIASSNFEVGGALYDTYNTYDKDGNKDMATSESLASGTDMMDIDFGFASNLLLPVELIAFDAWGILNTVEVSWSTASELNCDFYVIERSSDGLQFDEVGKASGAGTSLVTLHYSYTDIQPRYGKNYYRLRQVDFDGKTSFSPVRLVHISNDECIKVYPTVTFGNINLQLPPASGKTSTVTVTTLQGQIILNKRVEGGHSTLNLAAIPPGQYLVLIYFDGKRSLRRISKQ